MHVLHLFKDYHPVRGGVESHIKLLSEGLIARGDRVTVLVTSTSRFDAIFRDDTLTIIKAARMLDLGAMPLSLRMLWHARHLTDVDVVNLHFPFPPGDLARLLVPHRPPLVVTYHNDIVRERRLLPLYAPLLRWTLDHAAHIIATSAAYIASSPWLRVRADRCSVVPLGVDVARFARPCAADVAAWRDRYGGRLVLFVGRLRYYKGLHVLIEAFAQVPSDVQLLLVGSGAEEAPLRARVQSAGLSNQVHFLGEVPDECLPAVYSAADVFVLPSHLRAEAFGIVQLEAQAAGLPVVCTALGTGTSDITQHGVSGFVVPPGDAAALARALNTLLANPVLARQMGAAGRQRAMKEFTHTRMVERIREIYAAVSKA